MSLYTSILNDSYNKDKAQTQGAEEPNSTFVNIKVFDLFRSTCQMLSVLFVYATVKPAGLKFKFDV